jgi:hypothetical protein
MFHTYIFGQHSLCCHIAISVTPVFINPASQSVHKQQRMHINVTGHLNIYLALFLLTVAAAVVQCQHAFPFHYIALPLPCVETD